jgi:hypothetical protein
MIKDRRQKSDALRYIVARRWFPQLEVDVLPRRATSKTDYLITDIDVLGSIPDEFEGYRTLLVDCKTGSRNKPISRALWLRGLMDRVDGTRGICIFKREAIERDHRLVAAELKVLLLTEAEFQDYVRATDGILESNMSYVAEIDNWESYFALEHRFKGLLPGIHFSRSGFWMCRTGAEACRKTISTLILVRSELDPAKPEHIAVVGDYIALFLHALARLVLRVFSSYLQPEQREDLTEALLLLLYGGRDSYELANKLRKMIPGGSNTEDLAPPDWGRFVQLVRQALDAPRQALAAPLIAREVAWSYLSQSRLHTFAETLAAHSPQAGKFCLLATEYLSRAAKLPPEFGAILEEAFLQIQRTPSERLLRENGA